MKGLCDKDFKVSDDFSVVGIDNIKVAGYYCPEITTVAGSVEEMGKIAVKLLFKKVKNKHYNVIQNVKLSPKLIKRKSVKTLNNI